LSRERWYWSKRNHHHVG